jgi:hypothetical protein
MEENYISFLHLSNKFGIVPSIHQEEIGCAKFHSRADCKKLLVRECLSVCNLVEAENTILVEMRGILCKVVSISTSGTRIETLEPVLHGWK